MRDTEAPPPHEGARALTLLLMAVMWALMAAPILLLPTVDAVAAFYDHHEIVSFGMVFAWWLLVVKWAGWLLD